MKRFGILACVRFILVAAGSLHAQQFGNIVGELHVIRGDFPGRILIELQLHGAPIARQYTDEQGKFAFGSLTNNLYHVVVRDEQGSPVVYVLCEPATHYYQVMTRSPWMPVLVGDLI